MHTMSEKRIREQLEDTFPKPNKAQWQAAAQQETEGKNPFDVLSWAGPDGLAFSGYYDKTDLTSLDYLRNFDLAPSADGYSGARGWTNLPQVAVTDISAARTKALEHLQQGADGVLFSFANSQSVFTPALLESIDWQYCNVSFFAQPAQLAGLADYVRKNYANKALQGIILFSTHVEDAVSFCTSFPETSGLRTLGLSIADGDPVLDIATALTMGVNQLDIATNQGVAANRALNAIAFSMEAGADVFATIAKFKALRLLWYQVAQAYGHSDYKPSDLVLHARSSPWIVEKYQPHGNLLKGTTAALSAVLGGCSLLTVIPEDENHSTMQRIARNVSSILREESHLDKVADPLAGSYAIDTLVHSFAERAWSRFQETMLL